MASRARRGSLGVGETQEDHQKKGILSETQWHMSMPSSLGLTWTLAGWGAYVLTHKYK